MSKTAISSTVQPVTINDALIDSNMVWLVAAIKNCKIVANKKVLIATLLYIEKERVNHQDKDNDSNRLADIYSKYAA